MRLGQLRESSDPIPIKFKIVTPSFNQVRFVERAVRSVIAQAPGVYELQYVVYDAESTDGSQDVLKRLVREFPQISLIIEPDNGQSDALQKGFFQTDADVLGWLNADDILMPETLKNVARIFSSTGAQLVYGDSWFIDEGDQILGLYPTLRFDREFLKTFCYVSQPSAFFKRDIYAAVSGIDRRLRFCMDYDLWIRISEMTNDILYINKVLAATRLHSQSKTSIASLEFVDEIFSMLRSRVGYVPVEWGVYREYRRLSLRKESNAWPPSLVFLQALIREGVKHRKLSKLCRWSVQVLQIYLKKYFEASRSVNANYKSVIKVSK
ncbi:MAG: glycosyltransferase family 2 protein [Verrucomicrobiota bacterium]